SGREVAARHQGAGAVRAAERSRRSGGGRPRARRAGHRPALLHPPAVLYLGATTMISFQLTSTQAQVKEFAHQFSKTVVRPISLEADRNHRIPDEFMLRLSQMRQMMTVGEVPAEYGGEGGGAGESKDK